MAPARESQYCAESLSLRFWALSKCDMSRAWARRSWQTLVICALDFIIGIVLGAFLRVTFYAIKSRIILIIFVLLNLHNNLGSGEGNKKPPRLGAGHLPHLRSALAFASASPRCLDDLRLTKARSVITLSCWACRGLTLVVGFVVVVVVFMGGVDWCIYETDMGRYHCKFILNFF